MNERNCFVNEMHEILKEYFRAALVCKESDKENLYEDVLARLAIVRVCAHNAVDSWAVISAPQCTRDTIFLSDSWQLTKDELQQLANKYRQNYTMLRRIGIFAVEKFGEDHGLHIITPDAKKAAYTNAYNSAAALASDIYTGSATAQNVNAWMLGENSLLSDLDVYI